MNEYIPIIIETEKSFIDREDALIGETDFIEGGSDI